MELHFRSLPLWLPWILWMDTGSCAVAATLPENRTDAIGAYRVSNWRQCQRLCWYRQPCSSFSHTTSHRATNCVLHSSQFAGNGSDGASPADWTETAASKPPASGSAGSNACDARPCDSSSFCLPRSDGGHSCGPVTAGCGDPDVVAHGRVVAPASRSEGSKATVSCHQDYVQSPRDTLMQIECQANGRWTVFPGECVQAVHVAPVKSVPLRLPWSLAEGWKACMRGVFYGENTMTFDFNHDSYTPIDRVVHLDFRRSWLYHVETIVVAYQENGVWYGGAELDQPPMSLQPGDNFTLTVEVTTMALRLTLNGDVYEVDPSFAGLDLAKARYFRYYAGCQLSYLNLAGDCAE